MNNKLFLDLHVVQSVPASCLNRDDTGSPKSMVYGGVTRGRVSSQCWKHAIREQFQTSQPDMCGIRSMWFVNYLRDVLMQKDGSLTEEKAGMVAFQVLNNLFGVSVELKAVSDDANAEKFIDLSTAKMKAITFLSKGQLDAVADYLIDHWQDVDDIMSKVEKLDLDKQVKDESFNKAKSMKGLKDALRGAISADMALFGRMVAQSQDLSVDAACSVAHAVSTHAVDTEYDYYTAVDDMQPDGETGAANLGTLEFSSMTMYRYATVDVIDLAEKIGVDTVDVVAAFMHGFIMSMPSGKSHSYANFTLPDAVYVALRADYPLSLASAFEKPVSGHDGYVADSVSRLNEYRANLYEAYGNAPVMEWQSGPAVQGGVSMVDVIAGVKEFLAGNLEV